MPLTDIPSCLPDTQLKCPSAQAAVLTTLVDKPRGSRRSSQGASPSPSSQPDTEISLLPCRYPTNLQVTTTHDKQASPSVTLSQQQLRFSLSIQAFQKLADNLTPEPSPKKASRLCPSWRSHETLLTLTPTPCHTHRLLSPRPPRL